jgi:predicted nucleic acid-binding protein
MRPVIDASVVAKALFPEPYSQEALALIEQATQAIVPDLLWAEIGSVIWKRARSGEITQNAAEQLIHALDALPCELRGVSAHELLEPALAIAIEIGTTVYDSLYLALAVREDAPLITADRKFYDACQHTPLAGHVQWIGDLSP